MDYLSTGITTAANNAAATQQTKPSVWDSINKGLNVLQQGANIYTQVKSGEGSGPGYNPTLTTTQIQPGSNQPPQPQGNNTKTILLVGGGVVLVGTLIWVATRKKSKRS